MTLDLDYGTFELPDADAEAFASAQGGFWDPELRPFLDAIPAGGTVFDVGAHVGLYTGYWLSRGVHVQAVEGHPLYWDLLARNIHVNHHRWVKDAVCCRWGCFAYSRTTPLEEVQEHHTPASNTWIPSDRIPSAHWGHPLDDILGHHPVSLIKIDAQGADLHVLLGASRIIARWHPQILIEYEAPLAAQHGHTADDYRRWIAENGYEEHSINGWNAHLTWRG